MAAWLEHAECQLQAVDQVFFAVIVAFIIKIIIAIELKKFKYILKNFQEIGGNHS